MKFPAELWIDPRHRQAVQDLTTFLDSAPLILTDQLANAVYLSDAAAELLEDRSEALVNRQIFSLLGYGEKSNGPAGFLEAITLPQATPWRGVVRFGEAARFVEASGTFADGQLLCGVVRIGAPQERLR